MIVDDELLIRRGLRLLLTTEPDIEVVADVGDGRSAVATAREVRPDVVLLDMRMPGMDGIEATRHLLATEPGVRAPGVLILTTFNTDDAVEGALRAGASGFMLKNSAPEDLAKAIRSIAGGDAWLSPEVTRRLIDGFTRIPAPIIPRHEGFDQLTAREVDILNCVAHGMSNLEVAAYLVVSEGTVKTHVSHILTKLDLRDRAQAMVIAHAFGLMDSPLPSVRGHPETT